MTAESTPSHTGRPHTVLDHEHHALVLAEVRASMDDGYYPDRVNSALGRLNQAFGIRLVCVWNYLDEIGYGGDSDFYLEEAEGRLHYLAGRLWAWLNHALDDVDAPDTAGAPADRWGLASGLSATRMTSDGQLNLAIHDLRDA
jgi:hypothetical protein